MAKPISSVQLGVARLAIECGDRPDDAELGRWLRSFNRALALQRPELNEYAAELLADVEAYRQAESERKNKKAADSSGRRRIPAEGGGFQRKAADSEHSQSVSQSDSKSVKQDPPPSSIPTTDPRVLEIIASYPRTRWVAGGGEERVHIGEADKKAVAAFLNENPDYPLLFAVQRYAKTTGRPKNLKNWLENPPAIEWVLAEQKRLVTVAA